MTWNDSGDGCFFEEPGLKRDTSQAVVETMQTQSDKFSTPGQARMSENTGLGILVHCLHVAGAVLWSP